MVRDWRLRFSEMLRQWTPRQEVHLESANEAFPIARVNAEGRLGIHPAKQRVKPLGPLAIGDTLQTRPEHAVARRTWKEPSRQRAIVQPGSADNDRQLATRGDVPDSHPRFTRVARSGVLLGWFSDVDEMMRDSLSLAERHLVGADVETPIHRGRIAADDLPVEAVRESNPQRALAGCSGTDNGNDPRPRHQRPVSTRANASTTSAANVRSRPICCVRVG